MQQSAGVVASVVEEETGRFDEQQPAELLVVVVESSAKLNCASEWSPPGRWQTQSQGDISGWSSLA